MLKKINLSLIMLFTLCMGVCAESVRYDISSKKMENTGEYSVVKQGENRFYSGANNFITGIDLEKGEEIILLNWNSYADIKPLSEPKKYTACKVVFTLNGEFVAEKMDFLENETYIYPEIETKKGYEIQWNKVREYENTVTVNAEYIPIEYTVTFMAEGNKIASEKYTVEDKNITIPAIPPKTGYNIHWESFSLENLGDVTVNAVYVPVEYTVTFKADNFSENKVYTVANMSITEPAVPEKEGYKGAWESYTLNYENITVNAVYTPIVYTVTFTADENTVSQQIYTIENKKITEPTVPEKTGYKGVWETYSLNLQNITVKAIYTPIEYTVTFIAGREEIAKETYTVEDKNITEPQVVSKTGYTAVWEEYTLEKTGNITVNAIYTPIIYKVTFMAEGKFVEEATYTIENKTIIEPTVPERAGYEGTWQSYELNLNDITVNAVYAPIEYTVIFKADNFSESKVYTVENMNIAEPTVPEKAGYTGKWESYSLSLESITVNAIYTPVLYKVTFIADGKTVLSATYTVENNAVTEPLVPEKTGYTGMWESYDLNGTGDVTVDAVYAPKTYIISFDVNGGEELDASSLGENYYQEEGTVKTTVIYDADYPVLPVPVHSDVSLEFAGWSVNGTPVGNRVAVTQNSTFVAVWADKPVYQVIFNNYYEDGQPRITSVIEGQQIAVPENPVKKGYTFSYWCTDAECENRYDFSVATGEINLYPKWQIETYTVSFVADSVTVESLSYTVENKGITVPTVPEKTGYTGAWENYTLDTGDVTVNAVYTLIEYTVIFTADGNKVATETYTIENKNITEPMIVSKTGYTGIWEEYTLENLGNITVNAIYTPIVYTVIFTADNDTVSQQSYTVEKLEIEEPEVPEKVGYTAKWENYGLNLQNITVKAVYTPIEYTVTFVADGKEVASRIYTVETNSITEPQVVSKTGYTAVWEGYTLENLENITVNAIYTPIEYTVTFTADENIISKQTYTIENRTITEPIAPEKTGYTAKWETYSLNLQNITVKAVYTPIEYTVTFIADGKEIAKETYTVENKKVAEPVVTSKAGYEGVWESYILENLGDVTVNAVYTPITYTVTFKADEKDISVQTYTVENLKITEPVVPAKPGYTAKWESYSLSLESITVDAVYTPIVYTVIFEAENNVVTKETFTVENMKINEPSVPEKAGYTAQWQDYTLGLSNIYVSAIYTPIEYTVTFKAEGATVAEKTFTVENMSITQPNVPSKTGYTAKWESYSLSLEDITVNAVYELINYIVTFKADGEIKAVQTYNIENMAIEEPEVPEKSGYTGEWESYSLNLKNITVNAVYTPIEYTVSFVVDGQQISSSSYTVEDKDIDYPEVPAQEWYDGKWEEHILETGDVTINAVYTLAAYTISFKADGTEIGTQSYDLNNQEVIFPEIPEKADHRAVWEKYEVVPGGMTINVRYISQETDDENAEEKFHYTNLVTDLSKISYTGTKKKILNYIIDVAKGVVADIDYGIIITEEHIKSTYSGTIKEAKELISTLTENEKAKIQGDIGRKIRDVTTFNYFNDFYDKYF